MCYVLNSVPLKFIEATTRNNSESLYLRVGPFKEMIKLKWDPYGGLYSNLTGVLVRRRDLGTQRDTRHVHEQRNEQWGNSKEMAICKPRRAFLEETKVADTLILSFPVFRIVRK